MKPPPQAAPDARALAAIIALLSKCPLNEWNRELIVAELRALLPTAPPTVTDARALAADIRKHLLATDTWQRHGHEEDHRAKLAEVAAALEALLPTAPPAETAELKALKEAADRYHEAFWAWDLSDETSPDFPDLEAARDDALESLGCAAFEEAAMRSYNKREAAQ